MNTVTLTGRLTRDPELRELPSGDSVCSMRVAVDRMGRGEEAGFVTVSSFGKSGEACAQILTKGWLVAVDGRLEHSEWIAEDGTQRSALQVIGQVEFLAAPRDHDTPGEPVAVGATDSDGDDIPF